MALLYRDGEQVLLHTCHRVSLIPQREKSALKINVSLDRKLRPCPRDPAIQNRRRIRYKDAAQTIAHPQTRILEQQRVGTDHIDGETILIPDKANVQWRKRRTL